MYKMSYEVESSDIPQYLTVSFITLFVNWYYNKLLTLIRQFLFIPNSINEFMAHRDLLPELILPEFDQCLAIYALSILLQQFQLQEDWDQVLMIQLYALLSS
jgi:hypothetical protein